MQCRLFRMSSSSVVTPSDFVVATCFTQVPFIVTDGKVARIFSLWSGHFSINSAFRLSLFAFNQVCIFNRSSLRHDLMLFTLLSTYVRCVSSAYGLGSYTIRVAVDRGWSPEEHRRLIHGCQIRTHQQSIVVCDSPNMI